MRLPGFNASSTLYKTSGHYRVAEAGENYSGAVGLRPMPESHSPPPQSPGAFASFPSKPDRIVRNCDPCYSSNGVCLQRCETCVPCPPGKLPNGCGGCTTTTVPCTAGTPQCNPGEVASCGICCPTGQVNCFGTCVDTSIDAPNCGTCGNSCPTGQPCLGGQCICVFGTFCDGQCCGEGQDCFNNCCATNTSGLTLSSSSNYLLTNGKNCQNIKDLKVSLKVTQDMFAISPTLGGDAGCTMQLNAYNPAGPTTNWMQYIFLVSGNAIQYQVQYWDMAAACACVSPGSPCTCTGPLVNKSGTVLSLPNNTIPAGYTLQIDLNNDTAGNITGALFSVTDNNGNTKSQTATLDANHHFPIVAFQVNVVGPDNFSDSQFSSGAGTITYGTSTGQLCVEGGLPDTCSNSLGSNTPTGETSNAIYGPIQSPCCASELTQSLSTPVPPSIPCCPTGTKCCDKCRPRPDRTGLICGDGKPGNCIPLDDDCQ
jgi:hypothetical protein